MQCFQDAININQQFWEAIYNLGKLQYYYQEAEKCFQQTKQYIARSLLFIAYCKLMQNQNGLAMTLIKEYLVKNQQHDDFAASLMSGSLLNMNDILEAQKSLKKLMINQILKSSIISLFYAKGSYNIILGLLYYTVLLN